MLDILAWTYDKYPNEVFLSIVLVLGLVVALSLRQRFLIGSYLSTSQIPDFLHRDLKGKLCLVTNAFSSSESLALVDRLLARGAHLVLLCQPQDAKDPNVLQIYALLRHNHPSGITREVYIEPIDLYSRSSIQEFAQLFESKGSKRNGALGERFLSQPITCLTLD